MIGKLAYDLRRDLQTLFRRTASLLRREGEDPARLRILGGVRMWFPKAAFPSTKTGSDR
jgi:hypothetical protein